MSVKKEKKSTGTSQLENLNIETLNEQEQKNIKGGSQDGIITAVHPS